MLALASAHTIEILLDTKMNLMLLIRALFVVVIVMVREMAHN